MKNPRPSIPVVAVQGDADPDIAYQGGSVGGYAVHNPSVEDRMAHLAKADRCAPNPKVADSVPGLTVRTWKQCAPGNAVTLYTIHGGGHVWPRAEVSVDATLAILDFFDAHS